MGPNAAARLGRLCSLFSLFVRPPKLLRALAEGAAKMPSEVGLIGKASFRSDIGKRGLFVDEQQLLGASEPTG